MHVTAYDTLDDLVKSFSIYTHEETLPNIQLVIINHEGNEDYDDNNKTESKYLPSIKLSIKDITPKLWSSIFSKTRLTFIHFNDLDLVYSVLCQTLLRLQLMDKVNDMIVIDGLISCLSVLFLRFVELQQIDYEKLNFRKLYLVLDKIHEIDEISGYRVQLNETKDIWDVVDKIYIPFSHESDYPKMMECLSSNSESVSDKEVQQFYCLHEMLLKFNIKRAQ